MGKNTKKRQGLRRKNLLFLYPQFTREDRYPMQFTFVFHYFQSLQNPLYETRISAFSILFNDEQVRFGATY